MLCFLLMLGLLNFINNQISPEGLRKKILKNSEYLLHAFPTKSDRKSSYPNCLLEKQAFNARLTKSILVNSFTSEQTSSYLKK